MLQHWQKTDPDYDYKFKLLVMTYMYIDIRTIFLLRFGV